jgi:hypothetical protein
VIPCEVTRKNRPHHRIFSLFCLHVYDLLLIQTKGRCISYCLSACLQNIINVRHIRVNEAHSRFRMAANASNEAKDGAIQAMEPQDPDAPSAQVSGMRQSLSDKFTIVSPQTSTLLLSNSAYHSFEEQC